jgi:hypothetical protein
MMNNENTQNMAGIPMPIITLNRSLLCFGLLIAIATQQIWITTLLFLILLPAALFGRQYSLIFRVGSLLFAEKNKTAEREDPSLQRFNNGIATVLLGFAQIAFLLNQSLAGWIFSGLVALASGVALAGFCVGCFLYYQFKLQKYRLFRSN